MDGLLVVRDHHEGKHLNVLLPPHHGTRVHGVAIPGGRVNGDGARRERQGGGEQEREGGALACHYYSLTHQAWTLLGNGYDVVKEAVSRDTLWG
jgi:hypothetical protein